MDNNNPAPVAVEKKSKGPVIGMIAFAILAIAGVGFGVYGMLNANKTSEPSKGTSEAPAESTISLAKVRTLLGKYIFFDLGGGSQYKNIFDAGLVDEYK